MSEMAHRAGNLLQLVSAAVISPSMVFGFLLGVYCILSLFTVLIFQLKWTSDRVGKANEQAAGDANPSGYATRAQKREAAELADLAERKGVVTRIGHNFPKNPAHAVARDLIQSGEIGDIQLFRASMHVDVLADPAAPFMWRCDGDLAPTGAVGDIASHVFSLIDYLVGDIRSLSADAGAVTAERPYQEGFGYGVQASDLKDAPMRAVTNPDFVNLLCRLKGGGRGVIDVSRVATGRRFLQTYDIYGTKGGLSFDYDEINRIRFYSCSDPADRQGWREIDAGPDREDYAAFNPVANFGVGYNEFKAIEVSEVVRSVSTGTPAWPTFRDGERIMRIVDACLESAKDGRWVTLEGSNA